MRSVLLRLLALLARLFIRQETALRRVLVIKPDALGDLLLATPALRVLRQALPDAQITGLVGPWSRVIWAGTPDLDLLLDLPFPGFSRASDPNPYLPRPRRSLADAARPYWLLLRYAALLRRGRYDAALLLRDDHWWGAALAALAGIPRRVGHAHPLCAPFLTDALPYDPAEHVSRQGLVVVGHLLGRRSSDLPMRFEPGPAARAWADRWMATHLAPGERLVAIHPGASGPTKAWAPERWAALGDYLGGRGLRVVLTGGPAEATLAAQVAALMRRPPLSLAGATGVGQLAALLGRAALAVGGDTGPLHIAVSQRCPTIHLFGPSDPARFGPWGDPARNLVLRAGLPCSPCSSFDFCPRHTDPAECMDRILLAQVCRAADALLDVAQAPAT